MNSGKFVGYQFNFSAATEVAPRVIPVQLFQGSSVQEFTLPNGNNGLRNFRIFKEGTFKDSMGFQRTWESIHIEQFIAHFHLLKDGGFFIDPPLRIDHSFSARSLIGYIRDIYRDPIVPTFLAATVEFTEPEAWDKWKRGTLRARSMEVGEFETNGEALFWPVVMGTAFVDIGAVEGLYQTQDNKLKQTYVFRDEENTLTVGQGNSAPGPSPAPSNVSTPPTPPTPTSPPAPGPAPTPAPSPAPAPTPTPTPTTEASASVTEPSTFHAPAGPAPVTHFRVNGATTNDFAAVQRHIDVLETAQREQTQQSRDDFVTSLGTSNRILASQVESLTNLARSMTPEQFDEFRKSYEVLPGSQLLASHGVQNNTTIPQNPAAGGTEPTELETLEEIVAQHKRAGMNPEKIQKTSSYKKLQELKTANKSA